LTLLPLCYLSDLVLLASSLSATKSSFRRTSLGGVHCNPYYSCIEAATCFHYFISKPSLFGQPHLEES
jgi:hypothetical protein